MQLLLTDRLACPRCGPGFGLILLADHLVDRRVLEGTLGCPNCRDSFPVTGGFADLRAPPRGEIGEGLAGPGAEEGGTEPSEAGRLAALLGVSRGPGIVALVGAPARYGRSLADIVPDLDVVVVDPDAAGWPEHPGVSRAMSWPGLPFFTGVLRGVVVDGRLGKGLLFEAARVTAVRCRTVVTEASHEAPDVLEKAGLQVLVKEGGTVVAARG